MNQWPTSFHLTLVEDANQVFQQRIELANPDA